MPVKYAFDTKNKAIELLQYVVSFKKRCSEKALQSHGNDIADCVKHVPCTSLPIYPVHHRIVRRFSRDSVIVLPGSLMWR